MFLIIFEGPSHDHTVRSRHANADQRQTDCGAAFAK